MENAQVETWVEGPEPLLVLPVYLGSIETSMKIIPTVPTGDPGDREPAARPRQGVCLQSGLSGGQSTSRPKEQRRKRALPEALLRTSLTLSVLGYGKSGIQSCKLSNNVFLQSRSQVWDQ